jgi:hypothetical protein
LWLLVGVVVAVVAVAAAAVLVVIKQEPQVSTQPFHTQSLWALVALLEQLACRVQILN